MKKQWTAAIIKKQWTATIIYVDGERFSRVYLNKEKADRYAERQRKSPQVKTTRVRPHRSRWHTWRAEQRKKK